MKVWRKWYEQLKWTVTSSAEKSRRLQEIVDILHHDPETFALYQDALQNGVSIKFSTKLMGRQTGAYFEIEDKSKILNIRINPASEDFQGAIALAHELRHYWQFKSLGITPQEWNDRFRYPKLALAFNRLIEADAYAYSLRHITLFNGTAACLTKIEKDIQEAAGKGPVSAAQIREINTAAEQKMESLRIFCSVGMSASFMDVLRQPLLKTCYDPRLVRNVYCDVVANNNTAGPQQVPEIPIHAMRRLLKEGIEESSSGYMDQLSDRQLETLLLRYAAPHARKAVRLMEQFKAVNGSLPEDDSRKKELRQQIRKVISRFG